MGMVYLRYLGFAFNLLLLSMLLVPQLPVGTLVGVRVHEFDFKTFKPVILHCWA